MKKQKKYSTGFLFSTPNFLVGSGSVLNLAGSYYKFNDVESDSEADKIAIENDFRMVGQDISDILNKIKIEDIK